MPYAFLADVVTTVHLSIVAFMLLGLVLVLVGGALGWRWVRSPLFRLTHLAIMAYIAFNAVRGELCFLTYWEEDLRRAAGQETTEEFSFVGRLLHDILFVDIDQDVLNRIYIAFGALVVLSVVFVRPSRDWRRPRSSGDAVA